MKASTYKQTRLCFEFYLCLSRACLGKRNVFISKNGTQQDVFSYLGVVQRHDGVLDFRHVFAELLAQHFEVRHKLVDDPCAVVLLHAAGANVQLRFDVLLQLLRLGKLRKPNRFV